MSNVNTYPDMHRINTMCKPMTTSFRESKKLLERLGYSTENQLENRRLKEAVEEAEYFLQYRGLK